MTDDWLQTKVRAESLVGDTVIETSEAEQMNASALVLKELLEIQLKTQLGQTKPSM